MKKREPRLINHVERYLGELEDGWTKDADGNEMPFMVVRFKNPPFKGCTAYSTLGLSDYALRADGGVIRHELFMVVRDSGRGLGIGNLLQIIGGELLKAGRAVLREEVIGPRGPLWEKSSLEGLYATSPVYFPDEFAVCQLDDEGRRAVIVWLVPITKREGEYVRSHGWSRFEEILIREDPDLLVVDRDDVAGIC